MIALRPARILSRKVCLDFKGMYVERFQTTITLSVIAFFQSSVSPKEG